MLGNMLAVESLMKEDEITPPRTGVVAPVAIRASVTHHGRGSASGVCLGRKQTPQGLTCKAACWMQGG